MSSAIPTDPATIIIFGGSGDLSKRKLVPALFELHREKQLPPATAIVGYARTGESDETYRAEMKAALAEFARKKPVDEAEWNAFASRLFFYRGDLTIPKNFTDLKGRLETIEKERGLPGHRLFYLAIPPSSIGIVVNNLGQAGFVYRVDGGPWSRVIVEKPFGRDLQTARALNEELSQVFRERQIFRIDHYLGKETVQNLLVFRFANSIFEPLWNNHYVDHVQITVAEDMGLEGRASYYDESGALRDIVQNHLLQLVSLTAMEPPISFQADAVRDEKVKVLRAIRPVREDEVARYAVRGQYGRGSIGGAAVPSYRKEETGNPHSNTDTFVAMRLDIQNWRWAGTPFYVRTGKRLPRRVTEIAVQFKQPPHQGFANTADTLEPNLLVIRIQPDEGTTLKFGAKVPAPGMRLRAVNMDFLYGASFVAQSPEAYERLLLDVMRGDQTLFARRDEVETAWSLLSGVLKDWENAPDIPLYPAGSWGPEQADQLMAQDRRRWRHP